MGEDTEEEIERLGARVGMRVVFGDYSVWVRGRLGVGLGLECGGVEGGEGGRLRDLVVGSEMMGNYGEY